MTRFRLARHDEIVEAVAKNACRADGDEVERIALWVEAYGKQALVKEPFDDIAALLRRLLDERDEARKKEFSPDTMKWIADEARNKALDDAAAVCFSRSPKWEEVHAAGRAILALKTQEPKP